MMKIKKKKIILSNPLERNILLKKINNIILKKDYILYMLFHSKLMNLLRLEIYMKIIIIEIGKIQGKNLKNKNIIIEDILTILNT